MLSAKISLQESKETQATDAKKAEILKLEEKILCFQEEIKKIKADAYNTIQVLDNKDFRKYCDEEKRVIDIENIKNLERDIRGTISTYNFMDSLFGVAATLITGAIAGPVAASTTQQRQTPNRELILMQEVKDYLDAIKNFQSQEVAVRKEIVELNNPQSKTNPEKKPNNAQFFRPGFKEFFRPGCIILGMTIGGVSTCGVGGVIVGAIAGGVAPEVAENMANCCKK